MAKNLGDLGEAIGNYAANTIKRSMENVAKMEDLQRLYPRFYVRDPDGFRAVVRAHLDGRSSAAEMHVELNAVETAIRNRGFWRRFLAVFGF